MFPITWEGSGDRFDRIQIFDPNALGGEGRVMRSATIGYGDMEERQVTIVAAARLGRFQLTCWNGENKAVLTTRRLIVE